MKLRLSEYREKLPSRVGNARTQWGERAGLLVTLEGDSGHFGRGDAAPLPGYSEHGLDACRDALAALNPEHFAGLPPEGILSGELAAILPHAPPEVRFALESALLELSARRAGQPLHRLLRAFLPEPAPLGPIALTALVGPELESWQAGTRAALEAGYPGVKLKVGRPSRLAEELRALTRLQDSFPQASLRLDANGGLTLDALAAFSELAFEFLEEPLPLGMRVDTPPGVPVALDESLRALELEPSSTKPDPPGVVAWVLKLGPLGGFSRALALAEAARSRGIEIVPSHTFESAIGYAGAAELALALGPRRFAAGLAPYPGLAPVAALAPPWLVPHDTPGLGVT